MSKLLLPAFGTASAPILADCGQTHFPQVIWTYDLFKIAGTLTSRLNDVKSGKSAFASPGYSITCGTLRAVNGNPNTVSSGGRSPMLSDRDVWCEMDLRQPYTLRRIEGVTRQGIDQIETRRAVEVWASNLRSMLPGTYVILGQVGNQPVPTSSTWMAQASSSTESCYLAPVKTVPEFPSWWSSKPLAHLSASAKPVGSLPTPPIHWESA